MGITHHNKQTLNNIDNAASFTLAAYAVTSGSNRVLKVRASGMRTTAADFTMSCTFGGTSLSTAISHTSTGTSRWYRTTIFYLVAPAETTGDIVVTASESLRGMIIVAETLHGVVQSGTIGVTATNATTQTATLTLNGCANGSLIFAAVGSDSGNAPSWTWTTATEDYDFNAGANDTQDVAGSGAYYETGGGDVTITTTRSASSRPQAAVAAEFKAAVSGTATAAKAMHHKRLRG